jgi:DNA polymerase-3 subunit gamma/tau
LIGHFRGVLVSKVDPDGSTGEMSVEVRESVTKQAEMVDTQRLLKMIDLLAETDARMKWAPNKKLHLEIGVIKSIQAMEESSIDDVISLISSAASAAGDLPASPIPVSSERSQTRKEVQPSVTEAPPAETAQEPLVNSQTPDVAPSAIDSQAVGNHLEGESLWNASKAALIEEKPLFDTWLSAAQFVRHDGSEFVIGFARPQAFFRDSLSRYENEIEECLNKFSGGKVKLTIEVRDDLTAVEPALDQGEESAQTWADPPPSETASGTSAPADSENNFKDDPLIQKALSAFEARVIKS